MSIICFPFDAVSGAPNYTGEMLRNTIGALATKPSTRPIGAVSGVIPGSATSGLVNATSSTWTVNPFQAILDLEAGSAAGPYLASVSTVQTGSLNAANTYARIDLLSLTLSDPAEGDGTSTPGIVITYTVGSSSGLAPATPARSFTFAQISVPASGGGSPSTTWVAPFTVASGGITPAATSARPANPVQGQYVDDAAHGLSRWNGSAWIGGNGWTALPYASGWADQGGSNQTCAYLVDAFGFVHLRGDFKATSAQSAGTTLATLPAGFRPTATETFTLYNNGQTSLASSVLTINASGVIQIGPAFSSGAFGSLSGISFCTY